MKKEYDFTKGERGKFFRPAAGNGHQDRVAATAYRRAVRREAWVACGAAPLGASWVLECRRDV